MAKLCSDCNTKHGPGECPMVDGSLAKGRKSRRKNDGGQPRRQENANGQVKIAAHKANWSMIGETRVRGTHTYFSTWTCTVCSRGATNSSMSQNAKPKDEKHPATY